MIGHAAVVCNQIGSSRSDCAVEAHGIDIIITTSNKYVFCLLARVRGCSLSINNNWFLIYITAINLGRYLISFVTRSIDSVNYIILCDSKNGKMCPHSELHLVGAFLKLC